MDTKTSAQILLLTLILFSNSDIGFASHKKHFVEEDYETRLGSNDKGASPMDKPPQDAPYDTDSRLQSLRAQASMCKVYPFKPEISDEVIQLYKSGTKLIRFNLRFQNYKPEQDPLRGNFSRHYKLYQWERITSSHGHMLLSLAFNFDVLSLWLLTFDVEELDVGLVDNHNCMQYLPEELRYEKIRDLILNDFRLDDDKETKRASPDGHSACHQVILADDDGFANFTFECCHHNSKANPICTTDTHNKWVSRMYGVFATIKVLILLCGPMMVQRWFLTEPINKADYVVPLRSDDLLQKTMLVKKVQIEEEATMTNPHVQREMKQFRKFRRLVKSIPSDEIVSVSFRKLHVLVDHHQLMSERGLPIGIFTYIYEKFLRCGMFSTEPFASCCRESIVGTWGPKFLWFKLFDKSECNVSCRKYISWKGIVHFLGYIVLMGVLPLPYILRIVFFSLYEEDEIKSRQDVMDRFNYTPQVSHNLFQYWTPSHGGLITMYIVYFAAFMFLVCVRQCDKESCDDHISGAIQDMRGISYLECLRMLMAHIILPFEKFGICGIIVAAFYWPFAMPICLIVLVCYSVPVVYLSGRLLIHERPACFKKCPKASTNSTKNQTSLSQGTTSLEACLFLNNINPTGPQIESPSHKHNEVGVCGLSKQSLSAATYTFLVGSLCILLMVSLLFMYAEAVGFFIEACVMILLGAIVNSASTIRYVILGFFAVLYCANCYRNVYNRYAHLNKKLFQYIKEGLYDDLQKCVTMRHEQNKNTAFKFLSSSQIRQKERNAVIYFDSEEDLPSVRPKESTSKKKTDHHVDGIDNQEGHLHWVVHGLILFVDKSDIPRIPRKLFHQVCQLDAPGCPGPLRKTLGRAVKQLGLILLFLLLMFLLIMVLEDIAPISSTNEVILLVATGFLPLLILFVFKGKEAGISLNAYSFTGKVQQVILEYKDTWPVFDLSFKREYHTGGGSGLMMDDTVTPISQASTLCVRAKATEAAEYASAVPTPDVVDPTHVDLLITIRDENQFEETIGNVRSEPGSMGSHGSLNSGHRNSPDEPSTTYTRSLFSQPGGATGVSGATGGAPGSTNKPSNANVPSFSAPESGAVSEHSSVRGPTEPADAITPWDHGGSPRVDLVVDIAKGALQIRGPNKQTENCKNGIPMWPVSTKYSAVNENEPEASL